MTDSAPSGGPDAPTPALPGEEAVRATKALVDASPGDYDLRLKYASLLGQTRKYEEALAQLREASHIRTEAAEPHLAAAEIYESTDRPDLVLAERRKAVELEPANARAASSLGYTYVAFGWNLTARALLDKAITANPQDPALRNTLAMTLYQMMDYRGALREIQEAKRLDPKNPAMNGPLIDIYMRLNDPRSAADAAERAVLADKSNSGFRIGLARARRMLKDHAGAEDQLRSVLRDEPHNVEARYELALLLKEIGEDAGSQKALEAVVAANPLYESATALLAQVYFRQGRVADAKLLQAEFEAKHKAADPSVKWSLKVGSDPLNPTAHLELGKIHLKRKKYGRAIVEFKEALRLKPGSRETQKLLRSALKHHGRPEEALAV